MPKTLVLFHGQPGVASTLADAIADGARSVRFSEVTLRRLDGGTPIADLAGYDGIILGGPSEDGKVSADVKRLLEQAESLRADDAFARFTTTVGSAFASSSVSGTDADAVAWSIATGLANLGMIIVPASHGGTDLAAAGAQGRRVAELVSWVAHARSHAHSH